LIAVEDAVSVGVWVLRIGVDLAPDRRRVVAELLGRGDAERPPRDLGAVRDPVRVRVLSLGQRTAGHGEPGDRSVLPVAAHPHDAMTLALADASPADEFHVRGWLGLQAHAGPRLEAGLALAGTAEVALVAAHLARPDDLDPQRDLLAGLALALLRAPPL